MTTITDLIVSETDQETLDDIIESDLKIKLNKDLRKAANQMGKKEARFLVDSFYIAQKNRVRAQAQIRAMKQEPCELLMWNHKTQKQLELQLRTALTRWINQFDIGIWAQSNIGIGPILAAGLHAHIDVKMSPTAGGIWRFCGLDPSVKWKKGAKRPHNAAAKLLCWKIGESFVLQKGRDDCLYGHLFAQRKEYETQLNEDGKYKDEAKRQLKIKDWSKETKTKQCLLEGKLSPDHLHSRAKRWAVKMFLSHYHFVGRYLEDLPLVKPYALSYLGHAHVIDIPHMDQIEGLDKAWRKALK